MDIRKKKNNSVKKKKKGAKEPSKEIGFDSPIIENAKDWTVEG